MPADKVRFSRAGDGRYAVFFGDVLLGSVRKVHVARGRGESVRWFVTDQHTNDLFNCTAMTRHDAVRALLHHHGLGRV